MNIVEKLGLKLLHKTDPENAYHSIGEMKKADEIISRILQETTIMEMLNLSLILRT